MAAVDGFDVLVVGVQNRMPQRQSRARTVALHHDWPSVRRATLISGERDAVLVDALLTVGQADDLAEWIAAHGKSLSCVYITHGHGDHWFGLGTVLDRFPHARAFALPAVIEQMRRGSTPEVLESFWKPRFDGRLPRDLVFAEPLVDHTTELEGHELVAVELGHTDTDQTSCLHVPPSAWPSPVTPPTTTFTSTSPNPTLGDDVSGSPRSTRSSPYTRRP
jgi:hypothetical protein